MEGSDILVMIISMVVSFLAGTIAMMFFGGRTALNYLLVKISKGRKVLVFAKTSFGWRTFVAKKKENTLVWKYDKVPLTTTIVNGDIVPYMRQQSVFIDADKPANAIKLKEGVLYPEDFDPQTFNNLLIRAHTRPNVEGTDDLKKLLMGVLVLTLLVGFGVLMIYFQLSELTGGSGGII
jgi:hypothetical protein